MHDLRRGDERGFTLIEIMITVAIIGVLAAIAIPMFMSSANKARGVEALLQLSKISRSSRDYFQEHHSFPMQLAAVLPGDDGTECANKDHRFNASSGWASDPTWSAIDFSIGERVQFAYHYQATGPMSVHAWAVTDPSCSGERVQYDLYMEGRSDGSVDWVIVDPYKGTKPALPKPQT